MGITNADAGIQTIENAILRVDVIIHSQDHLRKCFFPIEVGICTGSEFQVAMHFHPHKKEK